MDFKSKEVLNLSSVWSNQFIKNFKKCQKILKISFGGFFSVRFVLFRNLKVIKVNFSGVKNQSELIKPQLNALNSLDLFL
jgi:hypothetical protein